MKHATQIVWSGALVLLMTSGLGCSGGAPSGGNGESGKGENNAVVAPVTNVAPAVVNTGSGTSTGPKAVVEKAAIDAGELEYGLPKDYVFPIRNAGDRPLNLFVRSRDCSCAEVSGIEDPVQPGKTAEVKVRWNPKPGTVGKETLGTLIGTNDPAKPSVRLTVEANINPAIRVSPTNWKFIDFERLPPDQPAERVLNVFSSKLAAFKLDAHLTHPASEKPAFDVKVNKIEPGEQLDGVTVKSGYQVVVRSFDKLPRGYIQQELVLDIEVPGEAKRTIDMPVYAFVPTGIFTVGPEEIAFTKPNIAEGDEVKAVVRFDVPTGKETVEIARVEPSFVEVAEQPKAIGNGVWQFKLRVPKNNAEAMKYQPDNFFEGKVYLKTKPGEGEVPVRLKWSPPLPR